MEEVFGINPDIEEFQKGLKIALEKQN